MTNPKTFSEFIRNATDEEKDFGFIAKRKAYGFYSDEYSETCVGLYACPKCHTVKMVE